MPVSRTRRLTGLLAANMLPIAAVLALCTFGVALAQSTHSFRKKIKPQVSSTAKVVFNRTNIVPGDRGKGRTIVQNRSKKPVKVTLTQTRLSGSTRITNYLLITVHDDTTNRCYWPKTKAKGPCRRYAPWKATRLKKFVILPKKKGKKWKKKERHAFTVSWMLPASTPNVAQGQRSSFNLTWNVK